MEVEEETTSKHLEEPMAAETTNVINENLIENTTTDKESEEELANLISKSNTQEGKDSPVSVPKSEDSEALFSVAVGEKEEDEKAEEVVVHCRNLESVAPLSGGIENLVVVEATSVVEHSLGEGGGKEIDVPSDDVASVDGGVSELTCPVGGGEGHEVVVVRNSDLEVVEEKVENNGEDTNVGEFSVIEKDENDCDVKETVREDEGAEVLKTGEEEDAVNGEGDVNVQLEDVENVQGMTGSDVRNDSGDVQLENTDDALGDEAMTEERVVAELKEEGTVKEEEGAEVLKDCEEEDVDKGERDVIVQLEDVEIVQGMTGSNVRNDGGDVPLGKVDDLQGDEAMAEERVVTEVVKVEGTVKGEEVPEALKDDEEDVDNGEGDVNVQLEDVENVQVMIGSDVENVQDGGDVQLENVDVLQGDEAKMEEGAIADEEEAVGVREDFEGEALMVKEETVEGVAGNDEEETMVEDEEKSLDIEMETEKLDTELETEKSLDTEMETEEEANIADEEKVQEAESETEPELPESPKKGSVGKRKRGGKISKTTPKSSSAPRKTIEEDVCFICFDGGDLVLCDRRNCPKAYHPSCVNRDEAFFQSKGRWNCGWHMCSICEKKAEYMCYTCTYSLCKACIKTSIILCVREKEKKGLCEACMKTVMLIENEENQGNINFDDKNSWEHLFKDYWTETKAKHNLSLVELSQAKNPWKGSGKQESPIAQSDSDNPPENLKARKTRRTGKKQKSDSKDEGSVPENREWVSKELLEFITHMRNGDSSVISQFEVQDLLLEYIKRNKLRDPNRKSQIICDARLEGIFGKPRVAHIEMLKLLESHFLTKDDSQTDGIQGTVVDTEVSQIDEDHKDRKRKGRKKGDKRGPQSNLDDYAAIDIHNITLIYLRRKLVEDLLDDVESFPEKIVSTFVRIRISGANQKQDIYRLVQVIGTSEAARYTIGKRTTSAMLEILNLDKIEIIPIDSISNQEFTEDECKRLRQSIKCGLISRLTVGDILDKAMELQAARVNDWLETEVMRLSHLRDRASDLGRKKELRVCVEKLNVLKTPEERARRLEEFPIIHDDPTMDPDYGSEDDTDPDDKKQETYKRSDSFGFNKRGRDQFSPRGDYTSKESWSGTPRSSAKNYEFTRNLSNKNFSAKVEDGISSFERQTETSRSRDPPIILEKPNFATDDAPSPRKSPVAAGSAPKVNESEKMWHYKDPTGKIQGPFSMTQLRKWNGNRYFPSGLKIWRRSDKEDDGIDLANALEGKFTRFDERKVSQDGQNSNHGQINPTPGQSHVRNWITDPNPEPNSRHDLANLPSPTPLVACGNKDTVAPGHLESSGNVLVSVAPESQGIVGSQHPIQSSQLGQLVAPPDNNMLMPTQMVQPVTNQNAQGWSNPSMNQWTAVPNMVPNQWNMVPDMQQPMPPQPQPPNVNWDPNMGWVGPNPGNPVNWAPVVQGPQVTANVNPGWVMQAGWVPPPPVQGGWMATPIQGPPPPPLVSGNGNPGWVGPPGNQGPPTPVVAGNGNPGWVGPPANAGWGGPPSANTSTGWVGGPIPNQGWVPPPGNTNQNWNSPTPRNHSNWGGNENQHNRGGFSGQRRNNRGSGYRGNRRQFHKDDGSFRGDSARYSDQ